MNMRVGYVKSG